MNLFQICSHERNIENQQDGTTVCLDCALVLEERVLYTPSESFHLERKKEEEENQSEEENLLLEIRERWNFPKAVISDTLHLFINLKKDSNLVSLFKKKHLLAFAFYTNLMKHECSRLPEEVAFYFEMKKYVDLFRIGEYTNLYFVPKTEDFLDRFAAYFPFTYKEKTLMRNVCFKFYVRHSYQPKTCAVIIIYFYLVYIRKEESVTIKDVCEKCGVNYYNVRNLLSKKMLGELEDVFKEIK